MDEKLTKVFNLVTFFSLGSSVVLSLTLFFYAMFHDYVFMELYELAEGLAETGVIQAVIVTFIESVLINISDVLIYLDYFWLVSFLTLVVLLTYNSYMSKKEGYFSVYSLVSYGIMFVLFMSSFVLKLSNWFYDLIVNQALENLTLTTTFFTFYINNNLVINAILICIGIILNVVDFDLAKLNMRKEKEFNLFKNDGN